ncbi:PAS domain-containing protein [Halorarius halobius]|uniref:PAS domain-containing protein n=1 Tax=Halorarius halobius TaxID=2962671 RepID=UPI0020CC3ECC|nr:PAS domain-containing protein [Halorarius halobius]
MSNDSTTRDAPHGEPSLTESVTLDSAEVLLFMSDGRNRTLLEETLGATHEVTASTTAAGLESDFDVCIVDETLFRRHREAIRARKRRDEQVFVPVLLTVADDSALRSAPNVWTVVDDLVSVPVARAELRARLDALLRQRSQSLTLAEREAELQEALAELRIKDEAITASPVGITITDHTRTDNPIQHVNEAFEELTGYDEAEITGHDCGLLHGPETREESVAELRAAMRAGRTATVELLNYRKDGTQFWNRVTVAPIHAADGTITNYVGFQEDVTEQHKRTRELRLNERRFEAVFEDPNILVGLLEPDGSVIDINRTALEYHEVGLSEITGDPFWETPWFTGDESLQAEVRELAERAADGEYAEFELDLSAAVDEELIVNGVFRPVTNDDGEVVSLVISDRDITDRKQQQRELAESEARYESLTEDVLDTSEVGTFILDENFDVVWINSAIEEYFGIDREAVVGADKRDLVETHIKDVFENPHQVQQTLYRSYENNARTEEFEAHVVGDDDREERWLRQWSQPIESGLYEGGRIEHYTDITERKRRDDQLNTLDRVLRHNMYNAMNVILGNAESIAESTSDDTAEKAESILSRGNQLLSITEKQREIVELFIDNPDSMPTDISTTIRNTIEDLRATYPAADVTVDAPDEAHAIVVPRFDRAITELVENGIIHTTDPQPTVSVSATVTNAGVRVRIRDAGPGIPDTELSILHGDGEQGPLYHGKGMGLSLVNRIVAYCGGTITYWENDDGGATIELLLQKPAG